MASAGRGSQHISAMDVNPSSGALSTRGAYYADDDSVVSSDVTDDGSGHDGSDDGSGEPEVARLTDDVDRGSSSRGDSVFTPGTKRWYLMLLILALLLILAVGLGTGLGLGLTRRHDGIDDGDGGDMPTYFPTGLGSRTLPPVAPPDDPDDLAAALRYHAIAQGISSPASFSNATTPQQRALDFLALDDTLPATVGDDEDLQYDDPLAVPVDRPYLTTTAPAYRVTQRYAAAALFYATDGDGWEINHLWLEPGVHECDWIGVTCEERPLPAATLAWAVEHPDEFPRPDDGAAGTTLERVVVAIDLPENNVAGTLPRELMALPFLGRLGLWNNKIGGSLPKQLGELTRLFSLLLDGNSLEGNIPGQLGQMTELKDLFLARNERITGRIPVGLGNLAKLERLQLSDMSLRGSLPPALSKLNNLADLSLQNNRLSRSLPDGIDALVNLDSLTLSGNQFTGSIPESWRNLSRLERLEVHSNDMSFEVKEWLCSMRTTAPDGGGRLETLTTDCQGNKPLVSCRCCTNCPTSSGL